MLENVLIWCLNFEKDSAMCCCCCCCCNRWNPSRICMPQRSQTKGLCCLCASCCLSYRADSTGFLLAGSWSNLGGFRGKYWGFHAVLTADVAIIQVPHFTAPAVRSKKLPPNCCTAPKRKCLEVLLSSQSGTSMDNIWLIVMQWVSANMCSFLISGLIRIQKAFFMAEILACHSRQGETN